MIEKNEDTLVTEYILNLISRHDWVDDDILMMYEECYRLAKRLLIRYNQDTKELDENRNAIMRLYGQL